MNYDEMSDHVINELVHVSRNEDSQIVNWNGSRRLKVRNYVIKAPISDYCNSWADMGPLIAYERLNFEWYSDGQCEVYTSETPTLGRFGRHKKPLRAAAICWLMIHDAKHTPGN